MKEFEKFIDRIRNSRGFISCDKYDGAELAWDCQQDEIDELKNEVNEYRKGLGMNPKYKMEGEK